MIPMVTVCAIKPAQMVVKYKRSFSNNALTNMVVNDAQMNTIISTGGSLSLAPVSTENNVGNAAMCSITITTHPRACADTLTKC